MAEQKNPFILVTGPLLVGALISYFLFGAHVLQFYNYCVVYWGKDRRSFNSLVVFVTLLEILQLVFMTHTTFQVLAIAFGDLPSLLKAPFSSAATPALNGFGAFCVQLLFAWRVWELSNDLVIGKIAAAGITLLGLARCVSAFVISAEFVRVDFATLRIIELKPVIVLCYAFSAACNLLITCAIVGLLLRHREDVKFRSSRNMVNTIIYHTVENMAIATVGEFVNLALYIKFPETFLYVCFMYILGRLYANILLATLNGRQKLREQMNQDSDKIAGPSSERPELTWVRRSASLNRIRMHQVVTSVYE